MLRETIRLRSASECPVVPMTIAFFCSAQRSARAGVIVCVLKSTTTCGAGNHPLEIVPLVHFGHHRSSGNCGAQATMALPMRPFAP